MLKKFSLAAGLILLALVALGPQANASYIITIAQDGNNVVVSGSGSIDLTDLTSSCCGATPAMLDPFTADVGVGAETGSYFYTGLSGPTSFGSAVLTNASSTTGDAMRIYYRNNSGTWATTLVIPYAYTSSSEMSGTATYDDTTIATLGLTVGTYTWTWGSGANADSLTVQILGVPEPTSLALLGLPIAFVMLRRRRTNV